MLRTATETACILRELYNEDFGGDESEQYLIGWDQLRGIAGVERLTEDIVIELSKCMLDSGYALVPFDNFLLVTMESNFRRTRKIPPRIAENFLAVSDDILLENDDDQELDDAE